MRNLNGYEIGGRTLRVDNACTEKSRMEMQQLLQGPQVENPYGEHCDAEQAPEIITKTVCEFHTITGYSEVMFVVVFSFHR